MINTAAIPTYNAVLGVSVGAGGCEGNGVRVAVGEWVGMGLDVSEGEANGAESTPRYVLSYELPYESDPGKTAVISHSPSAGGVHLYPNLPEVSLIRLLTIVTVLPSGPVAVNVTPTPVAFSGNGYCRNLYCIHSAMLVSEIQGVSFSAGD